MTAINTANVVLSQTSIGGSGSDLGFTNPLTVTIASMPNDEENLTKNLQLITPPKSTDQMEKDTTSSDYGANLTMVLDILNKVEQRITINGWLVTGIGDSDSSNDAEGKKADLKKIFLGGGAFNMLYEEAVFTVNSDKLSVKRINTDGFQAPDGVAEFEVTITMVRGENLV